MACFGSKPLRRKVAKSENLDEINGEHDSYLSKRGRKNDKCRKPKNGNLDLGDGDQTRKHGAKNMHERRNEHGKWKNADTQMPTESNDPSKQQIILRKTVDPETAKYFTEIEKLFEGNEVDIEERSSICGNALEETRGKEVELATDMIISHTLQTLVEGCDFEQLCGFLQNCAQEFPSIAMDKFGSHVAETSLKSLTKYLQDERSISMVEDTLTRICQIVALDAVNVMSSPSGSHVLRSLLCLCKGIPIDALEAFHVTKRSAVLAERLNCTPAQLGGHNTMKFQHSFPAVFIFLVKEMLKHAKTDIATLQVNKYSSFVLQTALKLLLGDDQELLNAILIILGCEEKNMSEGKFIEAERRMDIIALLEDTSFSHLFEVIIEVAPVILLDEFLNEVFKGSLFEMSSLPCGNFVVQALVASAKTKDQVEFFRMKFSIFNSEKAKIASKRLNPAEWWSIIAREKAPNLTRIAMCVLSQTVSSSNFERNWTTFSLIHTKTRNRLTMNNLKKLVYVHYNMRLRERNIKRKNNDDEIIDLDHIFHEDDPLAEWTCEVEDRLLDDRDNSWLDEALHEAPAVDRARQSYMSDERKKPQISEDSEDSDSPDEHGGGSNIGGGGVGASDVYGSGSGDFSGGGAYGNVGGNVSGSGVRFDGNVYQRGYGRDYHPDTRESDLHESYDQEYDSHGSYYPSTTSETQSSPYDNLMVSFFGSSQMQYPYPSQYDTMQEGGDDTHNSFEPHRSSFWW